MNGVMTDAVSAGSNHVGASETCTAHVISPSGAATAGVTGLPSTRHASATASVAERVDMGTLRGNYCRVRGPVK
jgi:hypothetical protein